VCGSAIVCGSAAIMCGSVRQCERQCAVVCAVVRTARSARGSVRQCAAVVIIIVILQPPCLATNCCYNNTAAPILRNNYYYNAQVIYGSADGLRTGHLQICGWSTDGYVQICGWSTDGSSTDLRVVYGSTGEYRVVYGLSLPRPWSTNWAHRCVKLLFSCAGNGISMFNNRQS
jgi:hypothetical protein